MATQLSCAAQSFPADLTSNSSVAQTRLGEIASSGDGRWFKYVKAGGTALVPGTLVQAPAEITNHQNLAPTANAAIGATSVTVTLGATAATANQYAGGWLVVTATPGQGYQYRIKSNPAADASATLTLTLEDPLSVAITAAASKIDLVLNPCSGVIINPTTASSAPVGVAVYPITASYYGWVQVRGPACILSDGGSTVGTNVSASNGTAGAVEAAVTAQAAIGVALTGVATTEYGMFDIRLG